MPGRPASPPSAMRSALATILIIIALVVATFVLSSNYHNVQAPAGYAAYVVERPIIGTTSFQQVLFGPASTGLKWRAFGDLVSVTPYSYSELFDGSSTLIAKDKLPIIGGAHIVWRLRAATDQIRLYMEKFGGLSETHSPDTIAKESYQNYIKEPFRTLVREEFAKYDGLAISEHLAQMGLSIQQELTTRLGGTPFEILQVVVGNAQPPPQVLEKIAMKVAAAQELERKATELEIANRSRDIEKANGQAAGDRELALAEKRAEANTKLAASLTPLLLQYQAIENLKTAQKVYLPLGANGLPIVATVSDAHEPTASEPKR
jgi:regulator of protease activity HflC (stomatin/prohibitin superfamily)